MSTLDREYDPDFHRNQNQLTSAHPLARGRLQRRVEAIAAQYGAEATPAVVSTLRHDEFARIWYTTSPQPVGITLRSTARLRDRNGRAVDNELYGFDPSAPRVFRTTYGRYYPLGVAKHTTEQGECKHEMYVDDTSVYAVELDPVEGYLVKTLRAECVSSVPRTHEDGEHWGSTETWRLPCPDGTFEFTTEWNPTPARYTPESQEGDRAPADMALTEARPISQDNLEAWAATGNYRNVSESWNASVKRSLPYGGRAATLKQRSQEFDFFAAACLTNAITWARSKE